MPVKEALRLGFTQNLKNTSLLIFYTNETIYKYFYFFAADGFFKCL